MKFRSNRERFLFFFTLLIIVGALSFVGYRRISEKLASLDDEISTLHRDLISKQRLSKENKARAEHYRKVKQSLTIEGSESEVQAAIRNELVDLFNRTGFPTPEITAKNPEPDREGFLTTYTYEIRGIRACTTKQLADFLHEMEESSDVLEIESINMQNPKMPRDDSSEGDAEYTIQSIEITRLVYTSA